MRRILLFIGLLIATGAGAQTNTAQVTGVVKDPTAAVLPGVRILATHLDTGFQSEQITDSDGTFLLTSLPIGNYNITAEFPGFKKSNAELTLLTGQSARLNLSL